MIAITKQHFFQDHRGVNRAVSDSDKHMVLPLGWRCFMDGTSWNTTAIELLFEYCKIDILRIDCIQRI